MKYSYTLPERIRRSVPLGSKVRVSSLVKSLKARRVDIEDCAREMEGFDLLVAIGGSGGAASLPKSEWLVERYE
jgi:hypothetical protein